MTFRRQNEGGRVEHRLEPVVLAATLLLVPVLIIESDAHSAGWREAAAAANWLIWVVFLGDVLLVLSVADRRLAALRAHLLDIVIVVLTVPLAAGFLASLRLLRLARGFRLLRLGVLFTAALRRERALSSGATFRLAALLTTVVVVVSGAAEATVDTEHFHSTWDGVWWAVVTVTTVGYGDVIPTTPAGRAIAIVVMVVGIGFLSILTATIASRFVQTDAQTDELKAALDRVESQLAALREERGGAVTLRHGEHG